MAAVINIDISGFLHATQQVIQQLQNVDISVRPIAVEMVGIMHKRIHTDGLDSAGNKIGQYSSSYLRKREKKGLGKGTDVVFVYTRKLSNSWQAIRTERGWGVGFVDGGGTSESGGPITALQKVQYYEQKTGKKILELSAAEKQYAFDRIIEIAAEIVAQFKKP